MHNSGVLCLCLLFYTCIVTAAKIPTYIKVCKADANLNKCALQSGRDAIPTFVKGDPKSNVPVLDPLLLDEIMVDQGNGPVKVSLKATDVAVYGLRNTQLKDIKIDVEERKIELDMFMPEVEVISKYDINGRVLVLPITGSGDMNVTTVSMNCKYRVSYDIVKSKPDGKDYMKLKDSDYTYTPKRVYFHFDNLFNGDATLGEHMNNFLNDNWQEVEKEVGPVIAEVIRSITDKILTSIVTNIPYEELLIP